MLNFISRKILLNPSPPKILANICHVPNDSGVFICKMKKKCWNYSSSVLYVKNGKKTPKLMILAFLCNINHKKKLFSIFIYEFQEKNAFLNNFWVRSGIWPDLKRVKNLMTRLEYHGLDQVNYPTRSDPCRVLDQIGFAAYRKKRFY
jgi:hypothetical protein